MVAPGASVGALAARRRLHCVAAVASRKDPVAARRTGVATVDVEGGKGVAGLHTGTAQKTVHSKSLNCIQLRNMSVNACICTPSVGARTVLRMFQRSHL